MAYDEELAARYRAALGHDAGFSEKRMMGGTCFFLDGNMIGGADRIRDGKARFMFRVAKNRAEHAALLGAEGPLLLGNRVMPGFYIVDAEGCDEALLGRWLALALDHARSLPPK